MEHYIFSFTEKISKTILKRYTGLIYYYRQEYFRCLVSLKKIEEHFLYSEKDMRIFFLVTSASAASARQEAEQLCLSEKMTQMVCLNS